MTRAEWEALVEYTLNIGRQMMECGAEAWRAENTMARMFRAYDLEVLDAHVIATQAAVTVKTPTGEHYTSTCMILPDKTGTDLGRLETLNAAARHICDAPPPLEELPLCLKRPVARWSWRELLGYLLGAGAFAIFFGGVFLDGVAAGAIGGVVYLMEQVRRVRGTQRKRREKNEVPVVAIVGYTNAGKSTLLNRLTGADIPANNRLFDTLDTTTRTLEISDTCTVLLSDTVGFIRKLPHHLVEAFKATLEELSYADLLLHVIDASNPLWREQAAVVEQLIVELGAEQTPRIDVFNKCDKFTGDILPHGADIVSISAKTGQGLDELLEKIGGRLDTGACRVVLRLPYDQGGVVDMLHRQAKGERVDYGEAIEVEAVCTPVQLGRLKDYIVSGWTPPKEPWED